jgi:hypothetical protein
MRAALRLIDAFPPGDGFRDPNSSELQQYRLPYIWGDRINYSDSPVRWYRIPKPPYAISQLWAGVTFVNDFGAGTDAEFAGIEQIPLAEQPEALTRAALEPCSGGAFHPGVELT